MRFSPIWILLGLSLAVTSILTLGGASAEPLAFFVFITALVAGAAFLWGQFDMFRHPNAFINYLHARSFLNQRKYAQALEHFDKALTMNPKLRHAHHGKATVFMLMNQGEQALLTLQEAARIDPNDWIAVELQSQLLNLTRDHDRAIAETSRLIERYPKDGVHYLVRGAAYQAQGEYESALADFEQAVMLMPTSAPARAALGDTLFHLDQTERALAVLDEALQLDANYGTAYAYRGYIYAMTGEVERGLADLERGISFAPISAAYFYRGSAYLLHEDIVKGINDFKKAREMNPRFRPALIGLTVGYSLLGGEGNQEEAVKLWRQLTEEDARYLDLAWTRRGLRWPPQLWAQVESLAQLKNG